MISFGKKGQSYIMQFVLFFVVGMALFIGIGNFFRMQYDIIRNETSDISIEMTNSYLSSIIVMSSRSCVQCASVESHIKLNDQTAGYYLNFVLNNSGLAVETSPVEKGYISSINNLNYSFDSISGSAPSIQTINLTYDRIQNKLEIR